MAPGGHGGWVTLRSYTRDQGVARQRLAPGTIRRIGAFARPYRRWLVALLGLILFDAVIGAANPLIYKRIIDSILGHDVTTVEWLAGLVAFLALVDAVVSLAMRWFSSRIGEGLIYDMRARVFAHVQRMPIAFFTRTQTGALITRLNNDVLGAQQAFTGTLSNVVSNVISVTIVLAAMFVLSWQITLLALGLLPVFIIPARLVGRRLQSITRESYALNAEMNTTMTERFNVSGALLVKLFGRPESEDTSFRTSARRVADIGVQQAMYRVWPEPDGVPDEPPADGVRVWVVRPRGNGELGACLAAGVVGLGARSGVDVDATGLSSGELRVLARELSGKRPGKDLRQLSALLDDVAPGDPVAVPVEQGAGLLLGEVLGGYRFAAGEPLPHRRPVRWLHVVPRSAARRPWLLQDPRALFPVALDPASLAG